MSGRRRRSSRSRSRPTPNQLRVLRAMAELRARRFPTAGPFRIMAARGHVPPAGANPYSSRATAHGDSAGGLTNVLRTPAFGRERRGPVVRTELKMHRTWSGASPDGPAPIAIANVGTTLGLSGIEQGSDVNKRIGISVRAHRLILRIAAAAPNEGDRYNSALLRFVVVRCKNAASGVDFPTPADLFEYPPDNVNFARPITSPIAHAAYARYSILDDFRVVLNGSYEGGSTAVFDRSINLGRNINWEEGFSQFDTASGGLYLLMVSDKDITGGDPGPRVTFNTELTYTDT